MHIKYSGNAEGRIISILELADSYLRKARGVDAF